MPAVTLLRVVLFTVSFAGLSGSASADTVACHALAAHLNDPQGDGDGVADGEIDVDEAVPACEAAVGANPDDGRLLFQLGRAFWESNRDEEAVAAFRRAALEFEHVASYAFLGIAYEYGYVGDSPNPIMARLLYQISLDGGFAPADALLAALPAEGPLVGDGVDPDDPQFGQYLQGPLLAALHERDFDALNEKTVHVLQYLRGMYEFFSQEMNFRWADMSCAYLHDTRLVPKVVENIFGVNPGAAAADTERALGRLMDIFTERMNEGAGGVFTALVELHEILSQLEVRSLISKLQYGYKTTSEEQAGRDRWSLARS